MIKGIETCAANSIHITIYYYANILVTRIPNTCTSYACFRTIRTSEQPITLPHNFTRQDLVNSNDILEGLEDNNLSSV